MEKESYFDGGLLQLIGWNILGVLITLITLGICYPWAKCMIVNWETKHTVIEGKRLRFDGHGVQLFGNLDQMDFAQHYYNRHLLFLDTNQNEKMGHKTHFLCRIK